MLSNYNLVEINSIEVESNPGGIAYDFEVEEDHSYNVEGIAVHNSICTTRIQTCHGMPTFQSVWECAKSDRSALLIADGGIRSTGDALKALGAGADMVMMGSMFAGANETPGEKRRDENGRLVKTYRGMASRDAQMAWRGFVRSEEGVTATALCKGPLKEIMDDIHIKLQTGFSYSGARSLSEYHINIISVQSILTRINRFK